MLDWLYELLGTMLYGFSQLFGGSYALALLLYALLFKVVFLPFTIKQQKNQIKSAKLAPKIALIRAKYKGRTDRVTQQKMQEEIMELQRQEGASPFAGCLPMLIQLPIIIFLYNVIRNPLSHICQLAEDKIVEIYNVITSETVQFASINQISLISEINKAGIDVMNYGATRGMPDFTLFGLDLALTPSISAISWLVLIPILAALSQWFTMWITRKVNGNASAVGADAQSQASLKMMDLIMPAMTLFIAFSFSGMLGLYWIYQSLFAIVQTLILAKIMPIPKYSEEELKAMRKAQKEVEKAQKEAMKEQPKYRSLHYIDDDDYDTLPEIKSASQKDKSAGASNMPEIKD